jgi:hypothetical protein
MLRYSTENVLLICVFSLRDSANFKRWKKFILSIKGRKYTQDRGTGLKSTYLVVIPPTIACMLFCRYVMLSEGMAR